MKPAHMLVLVSCVVLACGGGCFDSHCTPPATPAAVKPVEQPVLAQPAVDAAGQTVVVQMPTEAR